MHPQLGQSMAKNKKSPDHLITDFMLSGFPPLSYLKLVSSLAIAVALSACGSTPVTVEERDIGRSSSIEVDKATPLPNNAPTDTPLDERLGTQQDPQIRASNIERAEYYERLSKFPSNPARNTGSQDIGGTFDDSQLTAALNAAEYFIQANDFERAEKILYPHLNGSEMSKLQSDRADIVMAYVAYSRQQYNRALAQLNKVLDVSTSSVIKEKLKPNQGPKTQNNRYLWQPPLSLQQIDALLLSSFCHQALGDYDRAIASLLRRESGLKGQARAETTRYTWQIIDGLEVTQRLAIIESTKDTRVRNRLEQSLEGQVGQQTLPPQQFSQWREPSDSYANQQVIPEQWGSLSAKRVAVLLPLSSRFNKAAQALMDGIKYAHEQNSSAIAPQVSFYDIGDSPFQVAQHYNAAVNSGADFIIGPLGKTYANHLNDYLFNSQIGQPPTILLGGDTQLSGLTHRFTLSPESNGARVARKAFQDGHLSMALLMSSSKNSQRVADAFSKTWLSLGGKISKTVRYSPERFDHSAELKQLFGIYESEARRVKLGNTLGYKPKFSPYKRPDIDFVFMIADNDAGRILRPQINFYGGVSMPVYSDSTIFNGIQNSAENLDLERTQFPVMPWVLQSANVAPYAGQLNQLYALGMDTYRLAGNYQRVKKAPNIAINGSTGQLNINNNGVIDFQPVWASFKDGEAVATDTLGIDISPLLSPADEFEQQGTDRNPSNNNASYNDSNWDTRRSSRKTRE